MLGKECNYASSPIHIIRVDSGLLRTSFNMDDFFYLKGFTSTRPTVVDWMLNLKHKTGKLHYSSHQQSSFL